MLHTAVVHGEQTLQASSSFEGGDLMTNQAGDSEDDSKPHSKDQRMTLSFNDMEERRPVEITTMVSSDERHIGSGAHSARKDTVRLSP